MDKKLNNFIRRVDRLIKKHKYRLIYDFMDDWDDLKYRVRKQQTNK